jgi:hypothetical protein
MGFDTLLFEGAAAPDFLFLSETPKSPRAPSWNPKAYPNTRSD